MHLTTSGTTADSEACLPLAAQRESLQLRYGRQSGLASALGEGACINQPKHRPDRPGALAMILPPRGTAQPRRLSYDHARSPLAPWHRA